MSEFVNLSVICPYNANKQYGNDIYMIPLGFCVPGLENQDIIESYADFFFTVADFFLNKDLFYFLFFSDLDSFGKSSVLKCNTYLGKKNHVGFSYILIYFLERVPWIQ